jgi:hypothetical protein
VAGSARRQTELLERVKIESGTSSHDMTRFLVMSYIVANSSVAAARGKIQPLLSYSCREYQDNKYSKKY